MLNNGRLIAEGSTSELKKRFGTNEVKIVITLEKLPKDIRKFVSALKKSSGVKKVDVEKNIITITAEESTKSFENALKTIKRNKVKVHDLELIPPSLENAFIKVIEKEGRHA